MPAHPLSCSLTSVVCVMSDSNTTPPPPYDAQDDLDTFMFRRNFATLASDQQAIVKLFKDVALQLIIAPEFGLHHPLTEEWDRIRQVRQFLILAAIQ